MARATTPSNGELLRRCQDGDERAWKELIERFGSLILSVPHRYGVQGALIDDVFSDVSLALVNSLRTIRDPERLPGWIVRTATRCTWRVLRQHGGRDLPAELLDSGPEPVAIAEQLETEQLVREAVSKLPTRCRKILEQMYFASPAPSYDDVSASTGVPRGSLGPTRRRCLNKMREHLEPIAVGLADASAVLEHDTHA